jgi:cyclic pyranopterin phosphate synthase
MSESLLAAALFPFEKVASDLADLPIAARRALDHAGARLSLDGWRSLSIDLRRRVAVYGAAAVVDVGAVTVLLRRATPGPQSIERVTDPDPITPPAPMARALGAPRSLDGRTWARLRPLDRYALAHAHRRSVARNDSSILTDAFDVIVPRPSTAPPPRSVPPPAPRAAGDGRSDSARPAGEDQVVREVERAADASRRAAHSPGGYFQSSRPPPSTRSEGGVWAVPAAAPLPAGHGVGGAPASDRPAPAPPASDTPPAPGLADASALSSHLSSTGEARMVDVGGKEVTARRAVAAGSVRARRETLQRLVRNETPKGEVLATARVAGIMAAKRTHELIPLCHPLPLTKVAVHLDVDLPNQRINVTAIAETVARTGVEMEALTAVSVACLTVYDMLKGIDREMVVSDVRLLEKSGGRTGPWTREEP